MVDRLRTKIVRAVRRGVDYDDIGERLTLGRHSYRRPRTRWYKGDPPTTVSIGNYTSIAEDVEFIPGGGHPLARTSLFPFREVFDLPGAFESGHPDSRGDITVGSDVWIGRNAVVLSGVTIGHGAVVAGYSVVAKSVEPYAIVAGNPAREIRKRFPDDTCARLLASEWWNWPHDRVLAHAELLTADPEGFLAAAEPGVAGD